MKYSFKFLLTAAAGLLLFSSCKKVENKVVFNGGTSPTLTALQSQSDVIQLSASTKDNAALNFTWTNPDYKFNTGVSSMNVSYTMQFDLVGANFSGPNIQEKSFSSDLSTTITQNDLNQMLIQLKFPFDQVATFEVRIKSFVGNSNAVLYSNVLTFKAIPYLDVAVPLPTTGELYLVGGDDQLGKWANGGSYAFQNQQFTQDDLTTYSITVNLSVSSTAGSDDQFLFVPKWGDWTHKYACVNTVNQPQSWTGGKFGFDWSDNFPGPPTAGKYKIVVDFKLGTYTVTKL